MTLLAAAVCVAALVRASGQSPQQVEQFSHGQGRALLANDLCKSSGTGGCSVDGAAYADATDWFGVLDKSFQRYLECSKSEESSGGCKSGTQL
jgi:hypothetical protein